jgi:hypothetical protein
MSEVIVLAVLSLAGTIIGAAIGGFATVEAAKIKARADGKSVDSGSPPCALIGLFASLAAVVGLVLGLWFATIIIQRIGTNEAESKPSGTEQPFISPTPTIAAPGQKHTCIESEHTFVGDAWVSEPFFPNSTGRFKTFTHCPPKSTVQYNAIAIDDKLAKVERVCSNSTTDITHLFESYKVQDEILLHWRSSRIDLEPDCRIDFTVEDENPPQMGLMIKSSEP